MAVGSGLQGSPEAVVHVIYFSCCRHCSSLVLVSRPCDEINKGVESHCRALHSTGKKKKKTSTAWWPLAHACFCWKKEVTTTSPQSVLIGSSKAVHHTQPPTQPHLGGRRGAWPCSRPHWGDPLGRCTSAGSSRDFQQQVVLHDVEREKFLKKPEETEKRKRRSKQSFVLPAPRGTADGSCAAGLLLVLPPHTTPNTHSLRFSRPVEIKVI